MSSQGKLSREQRAAIVARRVAGERAADLAAEVGVQPRTVMSWVRAAGQSSSTYRRPDAAEKTAAVRRHLRGESLTYIARSTGRKTATISKWVDEAGHDPRRPQHYSAIERYVVLERLRSGEPVAAVAADTGIDPTTIRVWRRSAAAALVLVLDEVEHRVRSGETVAALAAALNVTSRKLRSWFREAGRTMPRRRDDSGFKPLIGLQVLEEIEQRLAAGETVNAIARSMSVTPSTVRNWFAAVGWPAPESGSARRRT